MVPEPPQEPQPPRPPERDSMGWMFIMVVALGASVIGILFYQMKESRRKSEVDVSGFNLNLNIDTGTAHGAPAAAPVGQPQSSLQMVGGAPQGIKFGAQQAAPPNLQGSKRNTDVMNKMQNQAQGMGSDQK